VNCANYIQNQMPHREVLHMTPEESWTHVKLHVSTFRVFGSLAWALIPDEKLKSYGEEEPTTDICWLL
jgi:hypothetical protein